MTANCSSTTVSTSISPADWPCRCASSTGPTRRRARLLRACGDLLPGWYDDWAMLERERVRQLQLHLFETAADELLRAGRHAVALELAIGALHMEPARQSAHRQDRCVSVMRTGRRC
jgi:two-component SAPR family response regulator